MKVVLRRNHYKPHGIRISNAPRLRLNRTRSNGQGRTKQEALRGLREAIILILEDRREDGVRGVLEGAVRAGFAPFSPHRPPRDRCGSRDVGIRSHVLKRKDPADPFHIASIGGHQNRADLTTGVRQENVEGEATTHVSWSESLPVAQRGQCHPQGVPSPRSRRQRGHAEQTGPVRFPQAPCETSQN